MIRTAALACLIATSAAAQDRHVWQGGGLSGFRDSYVHLHAPHTSGAVASLTFANEVVHSGNEVFALEWQGLAVSVRLEFGVDGTGDERITVTVPDGYIAIPDSLRVAEGEQATLHIFLYVGM